MMTLRSFLPVLLFHAAAAAVHGATSIHALMLQGACNRKPKQWCGEESPFLCTHAGKKAMKVQCCMACRQTNPACVRQPAYCWSLQVDGRWGSWGACSQSCGGGLRYRKCDSPAPHGGGAECPGTRVRRCLELLGESPNYAAHICTLKSEFPTSSALGWSGCAGSIHTKAD